MVFEPRSAHNTTTLTAFLWSDITLEGHFTDRIRFGEHLFQGGKYCTIEYEIFDQLVSWKKSTKLNDNAAIFFENNMTLMKSSVIF